MYCNDPYLYYRIVVRIAEPECVLADYGVRVCTTEHEIVVQSRELVLRSAGLYYGVRVCTTE